MREPPGVGVLLGALLLAGIFAWDPTQPFFPTVQASKNAPNLG